MVPIRRLGLPCFLLGLALLGGCSESLFGVHRGGQGDDDGGPGVPDTCTGTCIADVAADFDGTAGGKGGHWRYLDDHRDRTWAPMTANGQTMTGANMKNSITTCAAKPSAAACSALPGALLVSSAGSTSGADPTIEFTASNDQVIQLSLHAFAPSGSADQTIRIYRNSREDVLFTGTAASDKPLARAITLDALAGDRFLVAVAPTGAGATDVGLHLFISAAPAPNDTFPSSCQVALPFANPSGTSTKNACSGALFTQYLFSGGTTALVSDSGPFVQAASAVKIPKGAYLLPNNPSYVLDWSNDVTVQFWVKQQTAPTFTDEAFVFDDHNGETGGTGISIAQMIGTGTSLHVTACTDGCTSFTPTFESIYVSPPDYIFDSWQFIRVVRTSTDYKVCVNGRLQKMLPIKSSGATTYNPPSLGKAVSPSPAGAFFDGSLDDVRVVTGALPCD